MSKFESWFSSVWEDVTHWWQFFLLILVVNGAYVYYKTGILDNAISNVAQSCFIMFVVIPLFSGTLKWWWTK